MSIRLWSSFPQVVGAAVGTVLLYIAAVVAVRVAGRRTLAQMSAFDIVVTIALGSLLASTALPRSPALIDGLAVLVTLLSLQVLVAAARQWRPSLQRFTDFAPRVVLRNGEHDQSRSPFSAQLTLSDIEAAVRRSGASSLESVTVVVLESSGKFSTMLSEADDASLSSDRSRPTPTTTAEPAQVYSYDPRRRS